MSDTERVMDGETVRGLSACYSPINQAWIVMWGSEDADATVPLTLLRIITTEDETREYVSELLGDKRIGVGEKGNLPHPSAAVQSSIGPSRGSGPLTEHFTQVQAGSVPSFRPAL